jgi:hypothetical protein
MPPRIPQPNRPILPTKWVGRRLKVGLSISHLRHLTHTCNQRERTGEAARFPQIEDPCRSIDSTHLSRKKIEASSCWRCGDISNQSEKCRWISILKSETPENFKRSITGVNEQNDLLWISAMNWLKPSVILHL